MIAIISDLLVLPICSLPSEPSLIAFFAIVHPATSHLNRFIIDRKKETVDGEEQWGSLALKGMMPLISLRLFPPLTFLSWLCFVEIATIASFFCLLGCHWRCSPCLKYEKLLNQRLGKKKQGKSEGYSFGSLKLRLELSICFCLCDEKIYLSLTFCKRNGNRKSLVLEEEVKKEKPSREGWEVRREGRSPGQEMLHFGPNSRSSLFKAKSFFSQTLINHFHYSGSPQLLSQQQEGHDAHARPSKLSQHERRKRMLLTNDENCIITEAVISSVRCRKWLIGSGGRTNKKSRTSNEASLSLLPSASFRSSTFLLISQH